MTHSIRTAFIALHLALTSVALFVPATAHAAADSAIVDTAFVTLAIKRNAIEDRRHLRRFEVGSVVRDNRHPVNQHGSGNQRVSLAEPVRVGFRCDYGAPAAAAAQFGAATATSQCEASRRHDHAPWFHPSMRITLG